MGSSHVTLGDWIQDFFPDWNTRSDLECAFAWATEAIDSLSKMLEQAFRWLIEFKERLEKAPAVAGYEPLFVALGQHPLVARLLSRILVQSAKRDVEYSKARRPVADAIRFLSKPKHTAKAMRQRAAFLLEMASVMVSLKAFDEAGVSACDFRNALEALQRGEPGAIERVQEMAQTVAPHLHVHRGRRVSPASLAHEALLGELSGVVGRGAYTYKYSENDFTDALTWATRLAFAAPGFDPRPARRRQKRRLKRS